MKLTKQTADIFVPDGTDAADALARTTHLGIGAHQDDLEFMATHGILACFGQSGKSFTGVVCTDGAGSSRTGVYADYTDEQMKQVRRLEQRTAAMVGRYGAMLQLDFSSKEVKARDNESVVKDLFEILQASRPTAIYTHCPADKHDTHVGVVRAVIAAVRRMPADERPDRIYGCEIWRDLDWLPDSRKVVLDVSDRANISASLSGVFDSQISGGKRYDDAVMGRRRAHATFFESHAVDAATLLTFAMDLTPLAQDDKLSIADYVAMLIDELKADVIKRVGG
ncbi:MAG: PIG-L family deacetylase [Kiritimatiellae bacterium]|nr:PIG-L family deacetylase [Kiritimatiellia bacterium]MDD4026184.1 PIG-L family deacetylase [Kiritimatiellia bacterium]